MVSAGHDFLANKSPYPPVAIFLQFFLVCCMIYIPDSAREAAQLQIITTAKNLLRNAKNHDFFARLTLATWVTFVLASLFIYFFTTSRSPALLLLGMLPPLLSFFIYALTVNRTLKPWLKSFLTLASLVFIILFSLANFVFLLLIECFEPVDFPLNDAAEYPFVMEAYRHRPLNAPDIFPLQIPAEATNISFHANPPLLQGGERVQLAFSAPPELIQAYKATLSSHAQYTLNFADKKNWGHSYLIPSQTIVTNTVDPRRSVFMQQFINGHISYHETVRKIPDDFTVYILESKLHSNHPLSYGAAISPDEDYIIFFFLQG